MRAFIEFSAILCFVTLVTGCDDSAQLVTSGDEDEDDTDTGTDMDDEVDSDSVFNPGCDPDSLEPCAEYPFVCTEISGTKLCVGQAPAVPDGGEWDCVIEDGVAICRGDSMPANPGAWTCEEGEEGEVVCTMPAPVPTDDGADESWDCWYEAEFILCESGTGTDDGDDVEDGEGDEGGEVCAETETLCEDGLDEDCDGLVDCDDDDCLCDPFVEGCRSSERIAFIQGPTPADVRPGTYEVDIFSESEVLASPDLLARYDTIAYFGNPVMGDDYLDYDDWDWDEDMCDSYCGDAMTPGMEDYCASACPCDYYCGDPMMPGMDDYCADNCTVSGAGGTIAAFETIGELLESFYRQGAKVIIFPARDNEIAAPVMELSFHVHDLLVSDSTITVTSSNTMSDAFIPADYSDWVMLQMHCDSEMWCGDLFFEQPGYNGHFHAFRRDDGEYRGILIYFGLYVQTPSQVVDFGDGFIASHLELVWDPGFGTSDACGLSCDQPVGHGEGKPVIYLYPEQETQVRVELDFEGELVTTYPEYSEEIGGWEVIAQPDGTLTNLADGQEYSYIFWNGVSSSFVPDFTEGFVVRGEDTVDFLQQKLSEIGLLPVEYNELILYWLPYMEHHDYNLISFAGSEYTDIARMSITPEPDSLLRVFMVFKELDEPVSIPEQSFEPFERSGFTVVEWGGSEIGGDWHVVR